MEQSFNMAANGSVNHTAGSAVRIASVGHALFAATLIALGIMGLIKGSFTQIWLGVYKSFPAREVLAYLCALVALLSGIGLLLKRTDAVTSRVLLTYFLIWLPLFGLSHLFFEPTSVGAWWACGAISVMIAAAWVLYVWFADNREGHRLSLPTGEKGLRIARVFYGLAMIPFGIAHFTYLKETVVLVPAWLPWHLFWACFTGAAFIAVGIAIIIGVFARLAATLLVLQLGAFLAFVWIPIVYAGTYNDFQWGEFIQSCALLAAAWVVMDSFKERQ